MRDRIARAAALMAATGCACLAHAAPEPLWEAGAGIAGIHFPEYRGSDQSKNFMLPVPYFVYRGEFLKADREGVRGIFLRSDRVDLNLSVGASLPVSSSSNRAREGMEDLKPTLEVGPSLEVTLWRAPERAKLDMRLPLRAAFTLEAHSRFVGTQFFPHLNLDLRDRANFAGWNFGVAAGPVFTDARYNRYYYEVPAQDATAERPAYSPPGGGYGGMQFLAAVSKRFSKAWFGAFVRYDTLGGARFEESPLVRTKNYFATGFGISWVLGESKTKVEVPELGVRSSGG
jgi:outer membrane scaffolding protein for murein synthesis (MipA/OmpV family)